MSFLLLGIILSIKILREYLALGFGGINYLGNGFFAAGWGIGYLLADLDHVFYAYACNPQELSCSRVRHEIDQKNFRRAWQLLKETAHERVRLPVRNVLTGFVVTAIGMWIATSSGSLLANGVVLGLGIRLLLDFWKESDYSKWYWLFARRFEPEENKVIRWSWTAMQAVAVMLLLR